MSRLVTGAVNYSCCSLHISLMCRDLSSWKMFHSKLINVTLRWSKILHDHYLTRNHHLYFGFGDDLSQPIRGPYSDYVILFRIVHNIKCFMADYLHGPFSELGCQLHAPQIHQLCWKLVKRQMTLHLARKYMFYNKLGFIILF